MRDVSARGIPKACAPNGSSNTSCPRMAASKRRRYMKNTRATGLALIAVYISRIVCVLEAGFEEEWSKRGSSLMRLSRPKVKAEMETIQNALDKASKVGSVAIRLTVCEAVII